MQKNKQEKSLIKKNILSYLSEIGVTPYECYKKTGITRGVLTQKNGITEDNIAKFIAYYTDVSIEWLITGRGKMSIAAKIEASNLVSCVDMASEQIAYSTDKMKEENERLIAENQILKRENEDSNKKLVWVQDSLIKLMAEKSGIENLIDPETENKKGKRMRVRGLGSLNDPKVQMLLHKILNQYQPTQ